MIEDDLRAAFARHETSTPPAGPLRTAIDRLATRRRRRRRRLAATGTAFALVAAVGLGVPHLAGGSAETAELLVERSTPATAVGALDVLLVGIDDTGNGQSSFADSIMLLHVPADRSRAYLISIPRDLRVPIPGHGTDKLATAFRPGGAGEADLLRGYRLTRSAVRDLTGIGVDAGGVLTYPGLQAITDEVDGVRVCLPDPVRSAHSRRVFPAGCQHLDGAASVDLLRQRRGLPDDARDRDRNAQRYAAALFARLAESEVLTNPVRLYGLLDAAGSGAVLDTGRPSLELLTQLTRLSSVQPVGVLLPTVEVADRPGSRRLDDTVAPGLLAALREDRLAAWVAANPEHVVGQR